MTVLTDEEKERIRYHLGYMETSMAASLVAGIPISATTNFILENAMNLLVNPWACERVRKKLCQLDELEDKMFCGADTLAASALGTMKLHPLADKGKLFTDSLRKEMVYLAGTLADILGAPLYPFSARYKRMGPGSCPTVS